MASAPINLNAELDPTVRRRLQEILGPLDVVPISGDTVYSASAHLCRLLDIAGGLGEVAITVPAATPAGHSFAVTSGAGSWARIAAGGLGEIRHPADHTRGLPRGVVSVLVVSNAGGAPVVLLTGATQP